MGIWLIPVGTCSLPWIDKAFQPFLPVDQSVALHSEPADFLEKSLHALVAVVLSAMGHLVFEIGCVSQLFVAEILLCPAISRTFLFR